MAVMKQTNCGELAVGGGTVVNVSQNCGCGCGGSGGSDGGTTAPPGTPAPTGGTGGGTGGNPGDGTNGGTGGTPPGSGPDGKPNPDGLDRLIIPPGCVLVGGIVQKPYGSQGFEFQNASWKTALIAAVKSMPNVATDDTIVSAKLNVSGLAYGGIQILTNQPLVSNRKLSITDGENSTRQVAFTEEKAGASIGGIGFEGVGWRYKDTFSVMVGPNDVTIDGQMPNSFIPDFTTDANTPAWLKIEACAGVVRHKADTDKSYGFLFTPQPGYTSPDPRGITSVVYWDDSGINVRAFTDYIRPGDGNWSVDSMRGTAVFMTIPADKAYTTLTITGKSVQPDMTFSVEVFDRTVSTSAPIAGVTGSQHLPGVGLPANPPGTFDPTDINVTITMPPMVVGHSYAFGFSADPVLHAQAWIHTLEGKFAGA